MKHLTAGLTAGLVLAAGLTVAWTPAELSPDVATVIKDSNTFALDLYRQLARQDGNLFFSPFSISSTLAMTYAGARGETARQMAGTLHFNLNRERLHPAFGSLGKEIRGTGRTRKYQLYTANRLWGRKDYGFLPDFLKTIGNYYGAGLKKVDFINPGAREGVRRTINAWVEEQTGDKIKELIRPGILTADTRLVLTSAIYFKAAWRRAFEPKQTRDDDFTLADGKQVKARMMHGRNRTGYFKGDTFEALELPYEERDLSMIVLLPNKADGLPALEKRLTEANLTQWSGRLSVHQVDVTLPKFKQTSEFLLKEALSNMGMPVAFESKADFSGMATGKPLFISSVVHKAYVDVNEAGTEAAASTAAVMEPTAALPSATFRADHPFVYLIRDNRTGSILFLGRVANPS